MVETNQNFPGLNIQQKRHLHNTLLNYEKVLRQAERILEKGGEEGYLYRQKISLSPQQRTQIREKIAESLSQLAEFAASLGLDADDESLVRMIKAELNVSWTNLMNSRTNVLKGYGKVNSEATSAINPPVERLAHSALELSALFSTGNDER